MKHVIVLVLILTYGYESFCQQDDPINIYQVGLITHLKYLKSMSKEKIQFVYVERNNAITESLPKKVNEITISYLSRSEIKDKTRKGKGIELVVIRPVKVNRETLEITIIDFRVTSKKNNFDYANGGGSILEFRYNCDQHKFELTGKKQGGI